MKSAIFALGCVVLVGNAASHNAPWIGVWRTFLDGQPGATLTLANDAGTLGGTLVLDIVVRDGGKPHVIADEPHVLLGAHLDGNTLRFAVRKIDGSGESMTFSFVLGDDGEAKLHCVTCKGAPVVDMKKNVYEMAGPD